MSVKIIPVDLFSPDLNLFIQAGLGHHPFTSPPDLQKQELSLLNPFFQHAIAQAFVAEKDGKMVGRILATRDENLQHSTSIGHFGYFECINDQEVASMLFQHAESWMQSQGVTEIHGPMQLSIFNSYRFMISGFDTLPFLGEPRNPAYYVSLISALQYKPHAYWHSWDLTEQMIKTLIQDFQHNISPHDPNCQIVPIQIENFEEEAKQLFPVAMETFSRNYGYTLISIEEFLFMFGKLKYLLGPETFLKAVNKQGKTVGFSYGYPNPFASHSSPQMIGHTIGILPPYRKSIISYQLALAFFEMCLKNGYNSVLSALSVEGRTFFDKVTTPSRSYAIYCKNI